MNRFTDDELEAMDGEREKVIGKVQQHYARTREEAELAFEAWRRRFEAQLSRPVNSMPSSDEDSRGGGCC